MDSLAAFIMAPLSLAAKAFARSTLLLSEAVNQRASLAAPSSVVGLEALGALGLFILGWLRWQASDDSSDIDATLFGNSRYCFVTDEDWGFTLLWLHGDFSSVLQGF